VKARASRFWAYFSRVRQRARSDDGVPESDRANIDALAALHTLWSRIHPLGGVTLHTTLLRRARAYGSSRQVACALSVEAEYLAGRAASPARQERVRAALEQARAQSDDPFVDARVALARGTCHLLELDFVPALSLLQAAEQGFLAHGGQALPERTTTQARMLRALAGLGEWRRFSALSERFLGEARARKDRGAHFTLLVEGSAHLRNLVADNARAGGTELAQLGAPWASLESSIVPVEVVAAQVAMLLFDAPREQAVRAARALDEALERCNAKTFARTHAQRLALVEQRARTYLLAAASAQGAMRSEALSVVHGCTQGIRALKLPRARGLAELYDAQRLALLQRASEAAAAGERARVLLFEARLFTAMREAEYLLGCLLSDVRGSAHRTSALAFAEQEGITRPDRWFGHLDIIATGG
jgi:hypothetical protein